MTRRHVLTAALALAGAVAVAAYLHDPPWAGTITSGLRDWEQDSSGATFRWTSGHSSLFVPAAATAVTIPLRSLFPETFLVDVSVDDRWLATIPVRQKDVWVRTELPLPRKPVSRRFRRLELRLNRTVGPFNLGVELGPLELRN